MEQPSFACTYQRFKRSKRKVWLAFARGRKGYYIRFGDGLLPLFDTDRDLEMGVHVCEISTRGTSRLWRLR